ncbi:hypothetical protein DENSPDRAFT_225843 [Dentipellis sp. KUC8613]|nr:hypothetical protein DENSPDRAFT_225843 [Dentipellis sp. KUC8613]
MARGIPFAGWFPLSKRQVLSSQKIVVVRREETKSRAVSSGTSCAIFHCPSYFVFMFYLSQLYYHNFLHKRHTMHPKKLGPFHHKVSLKVSSEPSAEWRPTRPPRVSLKSVQGPWRLFPRLTTGRSGWLCRRRCES